MFSAMISLAACRASSTVNSFTLCSANAFCTAALLMSLFAAASISFSRCRSIMVANDSKPYSRAICALVLLLGLKGKYISSKVLASQQSSIFFFSLSSSLPCSSILFSIVSLRLASSFSLSYLALISPICTSSRPPVRSLR